MKTLVVFDFDDTLFRSDAKVGVKKQGERKRYLSSHEYATYKPKKGEEFDYKQFQIYPPNPVPILRSTTSFHTLVNNLGKDNVIILTARSNPAPVKAVLQNFEMPEVTIYAIGTSDPSGKAEVVRSLVEKNKYERVIVYEDSSANINAIRKAVKPLLGSNFTAFKVKTAPIKVL